MKKRENKKLKLSLHRIISNNCFALKLLIQACPGKAVHMLVTTLANTVMTLASLYFLRFAINEAQEGGRFQNVLKWLILLCVINISYVILSVVIGNIISPRFDAMMAKRLKRLLLTKTAECEISCYEDSEFYDKYTRAMAEGSSRCDAVLTSLVNLISAVIRLFGCGFLVFFFADPFLFIFLIFPFIQIIFTKKQKK